jgi:hypothetical protein
MISDGKEPPSIPSGVTAIEYSSPFDFQSLDPRVGNIFRIFIDHKFFSPIHPGIAERSFYGSAYYAPGSDIVAVAFHLGCVYFSLKRNAPRRRLLTIKNAIEISLCGEGEHHKRALSIPIPPELELRGVVLTVCIDYSPRTFPSVSRNGLRSREMPRSCPYSIRVSHFFLVTIFDEMPTFVAPGDFVRGSFQPFQLRAAEGGELSIPFSKVAFYQIFTRLNIANGMFLVFRIFFILQEGLVEVAFVEGTKMRIVPVPEGQSVSDALKKKVGQSEIASGEIHKFEPSETGLVVDGMAIDPILGIVMAQVVGAGRQRAKDRA